MYILTLLLVLQDEVSRADGVDTGHNVIMSGKHEVPFKRMDYIGHVI